MATGRKYTVTFNNVSVSAVQDLISIQSTSGMAFALHELWIGQYTASSVGNLRFTVKRFTAAYVIGSGGSSATPVKINNGDAAATVTGRTNDTTQTTSGTSTIIRPDVFNVINGYLWLPAPADQPVFGISSAMVISLDGPPGSAESMSGGVVIEELF